MFEWLKMAYTKGMATIIQCKLAVVKSKITIGQFKDITGEDYVV